MLEIVPFPKVVKLFRNEPTKRTTGKLFFVIEKSLNIMGLEISPQKTCSAKGIPSEEMTNFGSRKPKWE